MAKEIDTFTDPRDGQVYKTVKIGNQEWFAENLRFKTEKSLLDPEENEKNGRYYLWADAMQVDESYTGKQLDDESKKLADAGQWQGIAPEGWHIPSKADLQELEAYLGYHNGLDGMSTALRASSGWNLNPEENLPDDEEEGDDLFSASNNKEEDPEDGEEEFYQPKYSQGYDSYGFAAYPTCNYMNHIRRGLEFQNDTEKMSFISASENSDSAAFGFHIKINSAKCLNCNKRKYHSVRCIKNRETEKFGSFKDNRDGNIYKTIKIGNQEWLAENFRFKMKDSYVSNDDGHKNDYGRYYAASCLKEVCPPGWHIPTAEEWKKFFDFIFTDIEDLHKAAISSIYRPAFPKDKRFYSELTDAERRELGELYEEANRIGFSDPVAGWISQNKKYVKSEKGSRFWCGDKTFLFGKFKKMATWMYPESNQGMTDASFKIEEDDGYLCTLRLIKD